uniref:tRNA (34-2'-O)-methyltransferase regulator WDR6 n=1 Tax=Romanomermis culicivorax TaxID=13658 RepID=A0A915JH67_ROMCU
MPPHQMGGTFKVPPMLQPPRMPQPPKKTPTIMQHYPSFPSATLYAFKEFFSTCLRSLADDGGSLLVYNFTERDEKCKLRDKIVIFDYSNIHDVIFSSDRRTCSICGEKSFVICSVNFRDDHFTLIEKTTEIFRHDWLISSKFFGHCKLVTLLSHNRVEIFDFKAKKLENSFQCEENCLIYSGLIDGDSLQNSKFVSGTIYNEILIWRAEGGQILHRLRGHKGVIFDLTLHDQILYSVSDDRTCKIWFWPGGQIRGTLYGHEARIWGVKRVDENRVLTCGEDSRIILWDSKECKILKNWNPNRGSIRRIEFLTKFNLFICGTDYGSLFSCKAATVCFKNDQLDVICITKDGTLLEIQNWSQCKVVYKSENLKYCCTAKCRDWYTSPRQFFAQIHGKNGVTDLQVQNDENPTVVASLGRDGCLIIWRFFESWSQICPGFEWPSKFCTYSNKKNLIAGFKGNQFTIYDNDGRNFLFTVECGGGHRSYDLGEFSSTLHFVYCKNGDVYRSIFEHVTVENEILPNLHGRHVKQVLKIENRFLVTCSEDTTIAIWDIKGGKFQLLRRLKSKFSSILCMDYDTRSKILCTGGGRGEICIFACDTVPDFRLVQFWRQNPDGGRDFRYLSVKFDSRSSIFACRSDGVLDMFGGGGAKFLHLASCQTVATCLTRLKISAENQILSIGTDGRLRFCNIDGRKLNFDRQVLQIEKCGLTCLDVKIRGGKG